MKNERTAYHEYRLPHTRRGQHVLPARYTVHAKYIRVQCKDVSTGTRYADVQQVPYVYNIEHDTEITAKCTSRLAGGSQYNTRWLTPPAYHARYRVW